MGKYLIFGKRFGGSCLIIIVYSIFEDSSKIHMAPLQQQPTWENMLDLICTKVKNSNSVCQGDHPIHRRSFLILVACISHYHYYSPEKIMNDYIKLKLFHDKLKKVWIETLNYDKLFWGIFTHVMAMASLKSMHKVSYIHTNLSTKLNIIHV